MPTPSAEAVTGGANASSAGGGRSRRRGFALLVVLIALVLLSLLGTRLGSDGRSQALIALALASHEQAAAAADGAVHIALFHLLTDAPDNHWSADRTPHVVTMGGAGHQVAVTVTVADEGGKVNPNIASVALLSELMQASGVAPDEARPVAAAIADWREAQPLPRAGGAKAADYRQAGMDYGPPNAPFRSIDELRYVMGMTPEILAAIRPHLSLAVVDDPDRNLADPVVAEALRHIPQTAPLPGAGLHPASSVTITAHADGPSNTQFTRVATVHFDDGLPRGYEILGWDTRD